jgi:glycerol-3-phosphate dehydrogenase (NAD(P)+)
LERAPWIGTAAFRSFAAVIHYPDPIGPRRQPRVCVLGAGSWGSTVASTVADRAPTTIWARRPEVADEINARHANTRYLGELMLSPRLTATASIEDAVIDADVVVMATPSDVFRDVLALAAPRIRPWAPIVSLTKGLEGGSRLRMTEIVGEVLPGHPAGVLAGPNLAHEVLQGYAAAAVIAVPDRRLAEALQQIFSARVFRVYRSDDVIGCEIAGALKNVFAIAAGMAAGLSTGDNTRAMVITRGLAELSRLGTAIGGDPRTFAGLAGMGDLTATCISPLSRNRQVGEQLALGRELTEILAELGQVAEGVNAAATVIALAGAHGVNMPIASEVDCVLNHGRSPADAFRGLRRIKPTSELHGVA